MYGGKMKKVILKYLVIILTIYFLSFIIDTIHIKGITPLLIMGLVLLIVNLLLKPILLVITLPLSIITIGLFTFIVNAWTIIIADHLVSGINMGGFLNCLITAFIIFILNNGLQKMNES